MNVSFVNFGRPIDLQYVGQYKIAVLCIWLCVLFVFIWTYIDASFHMDYVVEFYFSWIKRIECVLYVGWVCVCVSAMNAILYAINANCNDMNSIRLLYASRGQISNIDTINSILDKSNHINAISSRNGKILQRNARGRFLTNRFSYSNYKTMATEHSTQRKIGEAKKKMSWEAEPNWASKMMRCTMMLRIH